MIRKRVKDTIDETRIDGGEEDGRIKNVDLRRLNQGTVDDLPGQSRIETGSESFRSIFSAVLLDNRELSRMKSLVRKRTDRRRSAR